MKILVIQTAFIGDIVLTTGLFRNLKQRFSNVEIHLITTKSGAELLSGSPGIFCHVIDKSKPILKEIFRLRSELQSFEFEYVLCVHRSLRSLVLGRMVRAKNRVSFHSLKALTLGYKTVLYPEYSDNVHYANKVLDILKRVDGHSDLSVRPEIFISSQEGQWSHSLELEPQKYITISPFSVWGTKMWPWQRFTDLGEKLFEDSKCKLVLLGGGSALEKALSQKITEQWSRHGVECVDLVGKTNLKQLSQVISQSKLLIANDSAPVHIASAFNIPTIAIFGPTVRKWGFFPLSEKSVLVENKNLECRPCSLHGPHICPKGHFKCMQEISVNQVFESVRPYLKDKLV